MVDFVIRNALIVDGTGKPGFYGSVAVKGDQIVEVGSITSPGSVSIDAKGLVLAPGIIDSHTHFDAQITWDPMVSPSIAHGDISVFWLTRCYRKSAIANKNGSNSMGNGWGHHGIPCNLSIEMGVAIYNPRRKNQTFGVHTD